MKIPKNLFKRDVESIEVGLNEIRLFSKDEIENEQIGYIYDDKGNEIKEWIGKDFLVIGIDTCCGDPIIGKIDEEKISVYSMFHDDWSSLIKIADSFKSYIEILKLIKTTKLSERDSLDKLLIEIKDILEEANYDYWEVMLEEANYDYWEVMLEEAYDFFTSNK